MQILFSPMSLVNLQANKGLDMESEEDDLVPKEGSSGIANKCLRMTAQTSLGWTVLVVVAHQDLSVYPFGGQRLQPSHPWMQLSQIPYNNPWIMGGASRSMFGGHS
jgi:hypothetical protein